MYVYVPYTLCGFSFCRPHIHIHYHLYLFSTPNPPPISTWKRQRRERYVMKHLSVFFISSIIYSFSQNSNSVHCYPDISFHTLPRHRAFKGENGSVNVSISLYFSYHLSFIVSHKILILYIVIPTYHFTSVE